MNLAEISKLKPAQQAAIMDSKPEEWQWVVGYEGHYKISNEGRVFSASRAITAPSNRKRFLVGKIMRARISPQDGGCYIVLSKNNRRKTVKVHRLVAIAFIPNPENKKTVNHIDGNRSNNRIENLEWATFSENGLHSCRVLRKNIGSNHASHKLSENDIPVIFSRKKDGVSTSEIASAFGVCSDSIRRVLDKRTWRHVSSVS